MTDEHDTIQPIPHEDEEPLAEYYILFHEGVVALLSGKLEKALELLLKSAELHDYTGTYGRLYEVLDAMGRREEAFPIYRESLSPESAQQQIRDQLCQSHVQSGTN